MRSAASLLAASGLAALCACRAGAAGQGSSAAGSTSEPATSVDRAAARPTSTRGDAPRGRQAGIRVIDWNGQRTYWVEHCPTDSTSPLREPCSMTRADEPAE